MPENVSPKVHQETPAKRDPVRWLTLIVLAACVLIFIWYVLADRHTPYTDQARFDGLTVPIVPRVSGYVTEVNVRLHSVVEKGEVLFQIDKRPFELAVKSAEAEVDNATQLMGARSARVKSATGRVGVARAQLDRAQRNFDRVQRISATDPGALSQADRDQAETALAQAHEQVTSAEADLESAEQQLGTEGPDNPRLRAAITALEKAQLDLAFTTLHAPTRGGVEHFSIDVGYHAQAGQPLATIVTASDVWLRADMRENNISNIKPGDPAEVILDVAPGRVFRGKVSSVGYGVSVGAGSSRGELVKTTESKGWLRDPQRFPVIVRLEDGEARGLKRVGGRANVVVFTGGNWVLNTIGRIRIRLASVLSYVR